MSGSLPPDLVKLYRELLIADMRRQLPGEALEQTEEPTEANIVRMVSAASRLALSQDKADKKMAYEIVTRVMEIRQDAVPGLVSGAEVILARLGNFPGRQLLRQRLTNGTCRQLAPPLYLSLEAVSREVENSVEGPDGRLLPLTDFQRDLLTLMGRSQAVSVSAPTSSGKSFVLALDLVRRLKEGVPICVVYVVPTRALIRQVMLRIVRDLNEAGLGAVPVRCVPIPIARESAAHGVVYVLTQERLMSLLFSDRGEAWITVLIIDEAQGISDGARGIVLQTAVEITLRRFPGLPVYFASPLTRNPEYLLDLFGRQSHSAHLVETQSPVSQNRLLVSPVPRKLDQAHVTLLTDSAPVDLGVRQLPFTLRGGKFSQRALLARAVTKPNESTIIYANRPSDAESIAEALIEGEPEINVGEQPDIEELIEFLQEHVHRDYGLIRVLKHRVGYHYGDMPGIVRSRIEDFAEKGLLRYICCTSTLLQGVNLPARHIVIEDPRRGVGQPMTAGDFRNLAGRAGRLLWEFHGNIWCVRPEEWAVQSYQQTERLQEITSSFGEVLADKGTLIRKVLDGELLTEANKAQGEAALSKVYSDFTKTNESLESSRYRTNDNAESLREVERRCRDIESPLPADIFRRSATVHPKKLNHLFEFLDTCDDLSAWFPLQPTETDSNVRMQSILRKAGELLSDLHPKILDYFTWLAAEWVHEAPLKRIIEKRLASARQKKKEVDVNGEIRQVMNALETGVRYHCVKFARAYQDVLRFVLIRRGESERAEDLPSLHVYLECGACSPVVLSLISVGLSRTTAILLKGQVAFSEDATPEDCLAKLGGVDLQSLKIPRTCELEVRNLLRPQPKAK